MQRIDDVVDNLAANVEELATELKQKIAYLDERHHLLKQLEELEPNSEQPIKKLQNRVELLQAIRSYGSLGFEPIEKLEARIEFLDAIGALEPNGPEPIKNLRERLRTLRAIQVLEPNGPQPIEDLRERIQALKAVRVLTPSGSDSIGVVRDRISLSTGDVRRLQAGFRRDAKAGFILFTGAHPKGGKFRIARASKVLFLPTSRAARENAKKIRCVILGGTLPGPSKRPCCKSLKLLERAKGIEPSYAAWEAAVLPLNYARKT